ncbi:hypothetical protein [Aminobacter sp. HY435]|uniref:hypothetical protein n=1 Tax=Aminobacter sp. HY435 TaxID=2970917 RepID=UPI0022B989BD|nr:hypothetical protein [Aminobacter sp. HY435]
MSRNRLARRNVSTTIRMTSAAFDMSTIDNDTGEVIHIPLANTSPAGREHLAKTLCELHGIGSRKQWSKYHEQKKAEAAERKARWRERRALQQASGKKPIVITEGIADSLAANAMGYDTQLTMAHREATVERRPVHTAMGA